MISALIFIKKAEYIEEFKVKASVLFSNLENMIQNVNEDNIESYLAYATKCLSLSPYLQNFEEKEKGNLKRNLEKQPDFKPPKNAKYQIQPRREIFQQLHETLDIENKQRLWASGSVIYSRISILVVCVKIR